MQACSLRPTDGGTTYTFTLRRGFRFSNGDPPRASAFARAINRVLNPVVQSPGAIFDMSKGNLAHGSAGANTTGNRCLQFPAIFFSGVKFSNRFRAGVSAMSARGIRFDPFRTKFIQFLQTDFFE